MQSSNKALCFEKQQTPPPPLKTIHTTQLTRYEQLNAFFLTVSDGKFTKKLSVLFILKSNAQVINIQCRPFLDQQQEEVDGLKFLLPILYAISFSTCCCPTNMEKSEYQLDVPATLR